MSGYAIKEIFYTLQGEGARAGRPAVFLRFAGCNLWSGREVDRATAVCQFCDTDFVGGHRFSSPSALAAAVAAHWPSPTHSHRYVVCTGGEPLLQLDAQLTAEFHRYGFAIAVETNGTRDVPVGVDWICVSPKAGAALRVRAGSELKLVYPQPGFGPDDVDAQGVHFQHYYLQPMDGPRLRENTDDAVRYCMANPRWSLSLQTHKLLGIR